MAKYTGSVPIVGLRPPSPATATNPPMQTFLPSPSFRSSAILLDRRRLGKQRVECLQLLRALAGLTAGWQNHPCTLMWRGHERALADYGIVICQEWVTYGYRDTCAGKIQDLCNKHFPTASPARPAWLGGERLHASHRSQLLRKDPEYYGRYNWAEPAGGIPYHWPVSTTTATSSK